MRTLLGSLVASLTAVAAAESPLLQGACYSPFHLDAYPLLPSETLNATALEAAIHGDFKLMAPYVSTVRTYYSNYYGINIAPIAAAHNVPLYLGVYMVNEPWYELQIQAAVDSAVDFPETVAAVLVGNENVAPHGAFAPSYITDEIERVRSAVANRTNGSVDVVVGTVQRVTEWLDPAIRSEMLALADACDIIGVNIYPFFDNGYDGADPMGLVTALWDQMLTIYPAEKLRLTETGFATGGTPPTIAPRVTPSLDNAVSYYNALRDWAPSRGGGEVFWYSFFDLRADDMTQTEALEKHFGFYFANGTSKTEKFP
ncbi:hypothetical protein ACHHYP_08531, partial [Achlya hypogyna]